MTATLDISKLRELHEKATQGPWEAERHGLFALLTHALTPAEKKEWGVGDEDDRPASLLAISKDDMGCVEKPEDAALIAYVRTHLPEILERLSRT